MTGPVRKLDYRSAAFALPELPAVAAALQSGLERHYASVDVSIVGCPDLRAFGAAAGGMCGSTALVEFGGEPYAHNPAYRGTGFDIGEMLSACGMSGAVVFGAGMADAAVNGGHCGELIPNALAGVRNRSRVARVGTERQCIVEPYPSLVCGPIANLFVSDGRHGPVIRIDVSERTGEQASLTQAMRDSLRPIAADCGHIGMGGVFKVEGGQGQVTCHAGLRLHRRRLLRQFPGNGSYAIFCSSTTAWAPACCAWPRSGPAIRARAELHLRPSGEHTHFCHVDDAAQQAGHYHGDVTPGEVHYIGYFNLAQRILRFGDIYEELGITP